MLRSPCTGMNSVGLEPCRGRSKAKPLIKQNGQQRPRKALNIYWALAKGARRGQISSKNQVFSDDGLLISVTRQVNTAAGQDNAAPP